jgi:type I restriction enzyme R subunit
MTIHTEINSENDFCDHLANHGWLYADGDASRYDRARAPFPDDVIAWLEESQPDAWEAATKSHGVNAGEVIISRLRDSINRLGTLDLL